MKVSINELFKYEMTAPRADTVDAEDFVGVKPRLSDSSTSSWMGDGQSALVEPIHRKKINERFVNYTHLIIFNEFTVVMMDQFKSFFAIREWQWSFANGTKLGEDGIKKAFV